MIDTLLRALDLRTGRFTSPHVERMTERISVDGEPLTDEEFVAAFNDVAPYLVIVDEERGAPAVVLRDRRRRWPTRKFAEAPVDVAVVEVGMGGSWDATNVADGAVAVVLPVAVDHARYLGGTPAEIAVEKAGIIKPGAVAVLAEQQPDVAEVLLARVAEVGASVVREGMDFGVVTRAPAVGGQVVSLQGLRARYDELFLPLYGAHQAQNAAVALAAVEAFLGGGEPLDDALVRAAFAEVTSPARLEIVRRGPTILLDAAHNPHGAAATAAALEDSFTLDPLIGVIGVMGDKDAEGLLAAFEPHLATWSAPRTPPSARCPPTSWPWPRARSSARTGSPSSRGWPTRSTRRSRWPRTGPGARRSAPVACSSPARSSPPARPGRC